jgi:glyoxylase-like metal-dependent hydrolase (beta-lactamase superfamily II)
MATPATPVRIHALSAGAMTSPLGGFLEGERGRITYPVLVFVIEHPNGLVVVDSGLHPDLADDSSRLGPLAESFQVHLPDDGSAAVGRALELAGFDPVAVDELVLTHLHFDHAGGVAQLPNARLVVQRREWASRNDERFVSAGAYRPDDFDLGHDRLEVDGDHDLFGDGTITLLVTDGHTAGHQSARVRATSGEFVLCGDCCYLRRTLLDEHLPPFGVDRTRQLAAIRRMKDLQRRGATLVFGHDPEQWSAIADGGMRPGI